jgi:hypothetical protein
MGSSIKWNAILLVLVFCSEVFIAASQLEAFAEDAVVNPNDGLNATQLNAPDGAASESEEEEGPLTVTTSASIFSAYMFRGINIYDGLSFQPSLQITYSLGEFGNISAIQFLHIPAQGEQYTTRYFEMDEGLSYDISVGDVTFSLTHYWYLYPNGNANTFPGNREFIATVNWDNTYLNPYFTFANEYHEYKVEYYEVGVSHTFNEVLPYELPLTVYANAGAVTNGQPYWEKQQGFVQSSYGMSTEIAAGPITVAPLLAYANGNDGYATNQWWGGVTISASF